jgi:mannose-6-phosphate isomerase-like protein (cupin superfamily)
MTTATKINNGAELFWFNDTLVAIHLSSEAGRDGLCVVEHHAPVGDSPPLHVHRNEDEVFHILKGRLRLRVDGHDRFVEAGGTALAPKGLPHTYRVESTEGARWLTITRGADFETMLREAARQAERAELPPRAKPTPEMIAALSDCAARNGIDIVGPPLT